MSAFTSVRFFKYCVIGMVVCFCMFGGKPLPLAGKLAAGENKSASLVNLLTAYLVESQTLNFYLACAEKAEAEGFPGAAYLFRGAARSEQVLQENHADAIKKMGGVLPGEIKTPPVQATGENLQTAIKQESAKYNDLYPAFLDKARQEREKAALRTFNFAKSAAGVHIEFFKQASADPGGWEKASRTFWVCSICGHLVTALNFSQCPICFNPLDKYVQVK